MKGSILDLTVIIAIMVGAVILGLIYFKLYNGFSDIFLTMFPTDTVQQHIWSAGNNAMATFMNMIPFLIIGSGIAVIVLAFLIPAHPIFVPLSIIVWIIYIVIAIIFSNFVWAFVNNADLIAIANQYPLVLMIVQNFPIIIAVFGMVIIIVMYAKSQEYSQV